MTNHTLSPNLIKYTDFWSQSLNYSLLIQQFLLPLQHQIQYNIYGASTRHPDRQGN